MATVQRSSSAAGSGTFAMRVSGLARKFWTMTSWMWPNASCRSRIANSVSMRSSRVSPIPTRRPVVMGTDAAPARRNVSSRAAGFLSGEPWCGPPFSQSRSDALSSIRPWETDTSRKATTSSRLMTPGLRWGNRPVSSKTSRATSARYDSVVARPNASRARRAAPYRSSGLSPSVNNASLQPASAPFRATASTSSRDM